MPWFDTLVGEPFLDWLRAVQTATYAPKVSGDPFATSMRDFDDVSEQLADLAKGNGISHSDPRQRLTDLRSAKLVSPTTTALSPLGARVINAWENAGIADDKYEHELPRQLILVCEAILLGEPHYQGLVEFWKDVADQYGADVLVDRWSDLFIQTYFSPQLNGFSPMASVSAAAATLPKWDADELKTKIASMVPAGDPAIMGLEKIATTIDGQVSRGKARKIFVMAILLALEPDRTSATARLGRWTIPLTSNTRPSGHSAIPSDIKGLCLTLLDGYAPALNAAYQNSVTPEYLDLLTRRKNVIFYGPPGTGKTHGAHRIAEYWRAKYGDESVFTITFHPAYAYEDFVWGWRPSKTDGTKFVPQPGVLLNACKVAETGLPVLLLVDEINRADTARVFGELITFIEWDKRGLPFRIAQDPEVERSIPGCLHVLGTMNTADRSVSLLDIALRRRFAFVEFAPDGSIFGKCPDWHENVNGINIAKLMAAINARLIEAGVESDRAIGHALFAVGGKKEDALEELRERIRYDIYPLVEDYCFSDRSRVVDVLGPMVNADGRLADLTAEAFITAALRLYSPKLSEVAPTTPAVDITPIDVGGADKGPAA